MSPQPPDLLLSGPRPGTSSSHPRFTAWLHLGVSKSSTSSSHLRLFYGSSKVAPGKTQVGSDLGLHHLGNPRTCVPSRQLQTMSEHHLPALPQLIFYGGGRWVVSGPSQSLQLTGLSKSLLLTCQQQSSLKLQEEGVLSLYKR